jgi:hypothetical protein
LAQRNLVINHSDETMRETAEAVEATNPVGPRRKILGRMQDHEQTDHWSGLGRGRAIGGERADSGERERG